jgi:hypothetical protein
MKSMHEIKKRFSNSSTSNDSDMVIHDITSGNGIPLLDPVTDMCVTDKNYSELTNRSKELTQRVIASKIHIKNDFQIINNTNSNSSDMKINIMSKDEVLKLYAQKCKLLGNILYYIYNNNNNEYLRFFIYLNYIYYI